MVISVLNAGVMQMTNGGNTVRSVIMEKMLEVIPYLEKEFSARQMRDVLVSHKVRSVGGIASVAFILKIHPSFDIKAGSGNHKSNLYYYTGDVDE